MPVPAQDDWQTVTSTFVGPCSASTLLLAQGPLGSRRVAAVQGKGQEQDAANAHLLPSAPPLPVSLGEMTLQLRACWPRRLLCGAHCSSRADDVLQGGGDLMSLEAPTWLPDSHSRSCQHCNNPFR